ncbi:MAG: type II toxin-antitoxin system RelE/ParE family toxin [Alphaproteobacteria bacterium]|nr:type II toxin-antitoxin system RelE/ParE family toxin [Alphaproteobacteria bacterium]
MSIKKIAARFYELPSGRMPVREWLLELSPEDRRSVGYDIQTVEFGWPIGMPTCRPLGDGLYEVRCGLRGGRIGRVMFCIVNDEMVLLHAFEKKTQKTPPQDLELARKRRKEIM